MKFLIVDGSFDRGLSDLSKTTKKLSEASSLTLREIPPSVFFRLFKGRISPVTASHNSAFKVPSLKRQTSSTSLSVRLEMAHYYVF